MNWSARLIKHSGVIRIAIIFDKNSKLIARIKRFEGSRLCECVFVRSQVVAGPDHRSRFCIQTLEPAVDTKLAARCSNDYAILDD